MKPNLLFVAVFLSMIMMLVIGMGVIKLGLEHPLWILLVSVGWLPMVLFFMFVRPEEMDEYESENDYFGDDNA